MANIKTTAEAQPFISKKETFGACGGFVNFWARFSPQTHRMPQTRLKIASSSFHAPFRKKDIIRNTKIYDAKMALYIKWNELMGRVFSPKQAVGRQIHERSSRRVVARNSKTPLFR